MNLQDFRKRLGLNGTKVAQPYSVPDSLLFLGSTHDERVNNLILKILPSTAAQHYSSLKKPMFDYIISFWEKAIMQLPEHQEEYRGTNLAKRPFLAPGIPTMDSTFTFIEQYRWDTYFHNRGFVQVGGVEMAINQLMNFVDVYSEFKRIPNALVTSYLSHCEPPLESFAVFDLIDAGVKDERIHTIMDMIEEELFTEWLDNGRGKRYERQTDEMVAQYGLLTRYTNMHFHALLAGCEDGKDHNWVTVKYGANYLPVQLNALVYGIIDRLEQYYQHADLGNDPNKASVYSEIKKQFAADFQKVFWVNEGQWQGFRNYSTLKGQSGPILYGDLSAEIFPLFVKIATPEQAAITKQNLEKFYLGDYGLSATSLELRKGGTLEHAPEGEWEFQWEYPNCWAPLMLVAVQGLKNYGYTEFAKDLEKRWVEHVEHRFEKTGVFAEKYVYTSSLHVSEGFYGNVKGFGWTISTYLEFLKDIANKSE